MTTTTADVDVPYLAHSHPLDGSTNFRVNQNIVLQFHGHAITPGSGNIIISNGIDTRVIDIDDSEQVTFKTDYFSANVIIDPADDLIPGTTYNIQMTSGVIVNLAGNAFAGINNETQLNFTTVADTASPSLFTSSVTNRFSHFKTDDKIYLTFDETVEAGSGLIIISNGEDTRSIDINDANQVTFDGGTVTINPADDLVVNTTYNVQMASGVIVDTVGHAYAGLSDASITTIATNPLLAGSNPNEYVTSIKNDEDVWLQFDETVMPGSGAIVISNGSDTRIIDINDASQVTFDSHVSSTDIYGIVTSEFGYVTINPTDDLVANTTYNVQIASGVIVDTTGDAYAGFSDANIATITSDPLLGRILLRSGEHYGHIEGSSNYKIGGSFTLYFDEIVTAGNGSIIFSNEADTRTIDINDTDQVSFEYGRVVINLTEELIANTEYTAQITSGAIVDTKGNAYVGFSDASFATIISDPLLVSSSPKNQDQVLEVDDNIELYFDEVVTAGNGSIVISNGVDTRIIDIGDTNQVTFEENQYGSLIVSTSVIINPTDDLVVDTTYSIQMASGVIVDTDGYGYAGIRDATTLNFTTIDPIISVIDDYPFMYYF